jgi:hypothetical protein
MKLLSLKYLFALICAFHMYAVGYEVYHHPKFLLIGLQSIGCRYKFMKDLSIFERSFHLSQQGWILLINYNKCNLGFTYRIPFLVAMNCFVPLFRKGKFCGVPSQAIDIVGCAVGRR